MMVRHQALVQLAPQLHEVVPGHRALWALIPHREATIHPGERLIPLAAPPEHGGDRKAVLGGGLALLAERDVGSHVALSGVDRAQHVAPAAASIRAVAPVHVIGRLVGGGLRLEAGSDLAFQGGEAVLAHHAQGVGLKGVRETVGVVLHAPEQQPRGLVNPGESCPPGGFPSASSAGARHENPGPRAGSVM
jgi:hypothetical protein